MFRVIYHLILCHRATCQITFFRNFRFTSHVSKLSLQTFNHLVYRQNYKIVEISVFTYYVSESSKQNFNQAVS